MTVKTPILALMLALVIAAPVAVAQQKLVDPAATHAAKLTQAAQRDPVRFAQDHANPKAVANETTWDVAYACYAIDYAHHEHGTPRPDLPQCEHYQEVIGVEPEKKKEEPVAKVENLTQQPVAQVQHLADDSAATVQRIVDHPASALDEVVAFVGRLVGAIGRLVGGLALLIADALGVALDAAKALAQGSLATLGLAGTALSTATHASGAAASGSLDALAAVASAVGHAQDAALKAVRSGAAGLGSAIGHASSSVGSAVSDATSSVGHAVGRLVDAILGRSAADVPDPTQPADPSLPADPGGLGLPCVDCLLKQAGA
jgi:hypothetical protein